MKKTLLAVAAMAMFSTAAIAEDYDNTAVKLTAKTENYSFSVKSPKTGATDFEASTTVGPVDVTGTWSRDGATDDYAIKVGKEVAVETTPLYVGADAEFSFGDSFTSKTRTLVATPYVGVSATFDKLTPFAEIGYSFKSTSNDIVDFSKNDSYVKVGASYALDTNVAVAVSVKEVRDTDFANAGDRQAEVGISFSF